MTPPTVQFIPASTSAYLTLATTTGWSINPSDPIRTSLGYVAGPAGPNSTRFDVRSDGFRGFIYFVDQASRDAWRAVYAGFTTLRITDGSSNVYENTSCTFNQFTTTTVVLNGTWTGTLPTNSASIIEIAP